MATIDASYYTALESTFFVVRESVTAEDLVDAIENPFTAHPTSNVIWDLTGCDLSNFGMNGMIKLSDCAKKSSGKRSNPPTINVVADAQESFLIKLYEEIAELRKSPVRYVLVSSVDEAFEMLGIENPFESGTSAATR